MVEIHSVADLQPGDVWYPANSPFSRCVMYEASLGSVLAYNAKTELAYYKHISQFALPPRVMRTGKAPTTILDAMPAARVQEAIDNQRKSRCQWS
jgi:hypothetical protein